MSGGLAYVPQTALLPGRSYYPLYLGAISSRPICHMPAPFLPWQGLREEKLGHMQDMSTFT